VLLLASIGVGAARRLWDETLAGREGALARAARSVAAVSATVPVVIDDADQLDAQLAVTLIENLIDRHDGQVLVVAAADPDSALVRALTARRWPGAPADRIQRAEADPGMGYWSELGWRLSYARACRWRPPAGSGSGPTRSRWPHGGDLCTPVACCRGPDPRGSGVDARRDAGSCGLSADFKGD
jgi:hypothetical protein